MSVLKQHSSNFSIDYTIDHIHKYMQFQSQSSCNSKAGHQIMGGKLSCCFHPKETSSKSGFHTEALRDFEPEVDVPWLILRHSWFRTGCDVSAHTSSSGNLSPSLSKTSQWLQRRGIRLSRFLHIVPLVLGSKVGWSWRGWNFCWGKHRDFVKKKLKSGQPKGSAWLFFIQFF